MNTPNSIKLLGLLTLGFLASSCDGSKNDYTAYFGGEIINPKEKWVILYKGDTVKDSISLDEDNRFFTKFDSLTPGLYRFKHGNEYQFVYFEKNDSVMARLNTYNFDESLVFCGRGEQKNNFLIESYIKTQKDREATFNFVDLPEAEFLRKTDSAYAELQKFYTQRKQAIQWSDNFDVIAKASIDYPLYTKKEFYPVAHNRRNQEHPVKLSSTYYSYRSRMDLNNSALEDFYPFLRFVNTFIDNLASKGKSEFSLDGETSLRKLDILDSITKNQFIKNKISNTIAFNYLMNQEINALDSKFFFKYFQINTDTDRTNEIRDLIKAIKGIAQKNILPSIEVYTTSGEQTQTNQILEGKTLIYFWNSTMESHFFGVHQKINEIIAANPSLKVISLSLDTDQEQWLKFLRKYEGNLNPKIKHYRADNLESLKNKWAVVRVNRSFLVDNQSNVIKGFINLFDNNVLKDLKVQ